MRELPVSRIEEAVRELFLDCCRRPDPALPGLIGEALARESSPMGREVLSQLLDNIDAAARTGLPLCQDTGMAVVFLDAGQDVHFTGGSLEDAVNAGVRRAYREGFFRKSVLSPLARENTGDNTPAVIHTRIVPGDAVRLRVAPKGFGSENMSRVAMLTPSAGREGVLAFIVDAVRRAGSNPCPPVVVGAAVGGTFEQCAMMAKEALLRPLGRPSDDPELAAIERELLTRINALGIGPMGFGGDTTALAVHIASAPTHIAGLPAAVNIQCHCVRHGETLL
ncbi:MAG: fumarate hydratase [Clostridiales bacterium]|nr:fumarate hydratase [Clostridiales bacterium]